MITASTEKTSARKTSGRPAGRTGRLLVLGGSLSLGNRADSYRWAKSTLMEELDRLQDVDLPDGVPTLLLTGGTPGPEVWAEAMAIKMEIRVIVFRADGLRTDSRGEARTWGRAMHPLARYEALVKAAEKMLEKRWRVRVTGLVDTTSPTHDTDTLLRLAKKAGLDHHAHSFTPAPLPTVRPVPVRHPASPVQSGSPESTRHAPVFLSPPAILPPKPTNS